MKYAVNEEGVIALRQMATKLTNAILEIYQNTANIQTVVDDMSDVLGPHKTTLQNVIKAVYTELKNSAEPVNALALSIGEVADAYQEIIGNDCTGKIEKSSDKSTSGVIECNGTSDNSKQIVLNAGKEWVAGLQQHEKEAVHAYTGSAYSNINATLRGLDKQFEPGNKEFAYSIHESLKDASIPMDCTVYRGVSSKALGPLKILPDSMLIGKVFGDKGFMSTSMDRNSAFSEDTLLVIDVPKGSHGAYVGDISAAGHYEQEVLFDAGQKMKITGVRRDEAGKRIIDVRILN